MASFVTHYPLRWFTRITTRACKSQKICHWRIPTAITQISAYCLCDWKYRLEIHHVKEHSVRVKKEKHLRIKSFINILLFILWSYSLLVRFLSYCCFCLSLLALGCWLLIMLLLLLLCSWWFVAVNLLLLLLFCSQWFVAVFVVRCCWFVGHTLIPYAVVC